MSLVFSGSLQTTLSRSILNTKFPNTDPTFNLSWQRTLFTSEDLSLILALPCPGWASPGALASNWLLQWLGLCEPGPLSLVLGPPLPNKHYSSSSYITSCSLYSCPGRVFTDWATVIFSCLSREKLIGVPTENRTNALPSPYSQS